MKIMNKLTLVLALAAGSLNAGKVKSNKKGGPVGKPTVVKATKKDSSIEKALITKVVALGTLKTFLV